MRIDAAGYNFAVFSDISALFYRRSVFQNAYDELVPRLPRFEKFRYQMNEGITEVAIRHLLFTYHLIGELEPRVKAFQAHFDLFYKTLHRANMHD